MTTAVVALAVIFAALAFVMWKAWRGGRAEARAEQAERQAEIADEQLKAAANRPRTVDDAIDRL